MDSSNTILEEKRAGAFTFSLLFLLESMVRSLNATVLSVQAYDLLGSAQKVSALQTGVSLSVLMTSLMMPMLLGTVRRRYAYTIGVVGLLLGALLLGTHTVFGQVSGMYFRNIGTSIANVTLQLYILDHIRKTDLARTEPLRLATSTMSWVAGPFIGVYLYDVYGPWFPQLASLWFGALLLLVFWWLRLKDKSLLQPGNLKSFNPVKNLKRFIDQPRLRLAWAIAFGRSCFWAGFFTYGPLLMLEGGMSKQYSGALISASQLMLLSSVGYGVVARRFGVRPVIAFSFLMMSISITLGGWFGSTAPYVSSGFLLVAAFFASGLDGVGGIPFLRAVKSHERPKMTPIYRTFIELSDLLPGLVYVIVLSFLPTGAAFIVLGISLLIMAWLSWRYLPKSM